MSALPFTLRRLSVPLTSAAVICAALTVAPPVQAAATTCADMGATFIATDAATGRSICGKEYVGSTTWTVPASVTSAQVVVVGGGAGGGAALEYAAAAGGGGGGRVEGSTLVVVPGEIWTVTVGSGGASRTNGTYSGFYIGATGIWANGGVRGGDAYLTGMGNGGNSGGDIFTGGSGSGTASGPLADVAGGGGGGAAANGSNATSTSQMAAGGYGGGGRAPSDLGLSWFSNLTTAYGYGGGGGAYIINGWASAGGSAGTGGRGGCWTHVTPCGSPTNGSGYGAGGGGGAASGSPSDPGQDGGSGYSGAVFIRFLTPPPPEAPTITSVTAVDATTTDLSLAFTVAAATPAITDVEYSLDGGTHVSMARTTSGTYTISGLNPGQSYAVRVFAVNDNGTSVASNVVSQSPFAVVPSFFTGATVSGNAYVGQALSVTATVLGTPTPSKTYQWYSCTSSHSAGVALPLGCTSLVGAVTSGYTVGIGDYGNYLLARVEASNAGGGTTNTADSYSATTSAVIDVPGAMALTSVTATGTTTADVVAIVPGATGGSPITGVDYSTNNGVDWSASGGAVGSFTITGLSAGSTYQVKVRARNVAGAGPASTGLSVTTHSGPTVATAASVSGTAQQASTLTGTDATFNGLPSPTLTRAWYACTSANASATTSLPGTCSAIAGQTGTTLVLGAAQVGTYVLYAVTGTNSVSAVTSYSVTSARVLGVPSAPTLAATDAVGTPGQVSLTVTAPVSDGGSAITGYQYSANPGSGTPTWNGITVTGGTATIIGLNNGTEYTFAVRAVNAIGNGLASNIVTVTPVAAPTLTSVTATGTTTADVVASLTAQTGGAAITSVQYSTNNGGAWSSSGGVSGSFTITGLSAGTTYQVKVRVMTAAGAGAASTMLSVTTHSAPTVATPALLSGTAQQSVALTGEDATFNGLPTPTLSRAWYACTSANASATTSLPGTCSVIAGQTAPLFVPGAAQVGKYILYAVTGTNSVSAITSYSVTVGPVLGVPGAPTIAATNAVGTPGQVSLTVTAPVSDGGSAITGYQYTTNPGGSPTWSAVTVTGGVATISGLTDGAEYTFAMRAINLVGAGTASNTVVVVPLNVPTGVAGTRGDASVAVTWVAPSGGGAAGYRVQVRTDPAGLWGDAAGGCAPATTAVSAAVSCTASGLTNGTAYDFRVLALNANGQGAWSSASSAVTPLSHDMRLSDLTAEQSTIEAGPFGALTLTPTFDASTLAYTASVANAFAFVRVTPTQNLSGQALFVNGVPVTSGTASDPIGLSVGGNTITITVQSPDRVAHPDSTFEQDYVIVVTRAGSGGGSGGGSADPSPAPAPSGPPNLGPIVPIGGELPPGSHDVTLGGHPSGSNSAPLPGNNGIGFTGSGGTAGSGSGGSSGSGSGGNTGSGSGSGDIGWGLTFMGRQSNGDPISLGANGVLRLLPGGGVLVQGTNYLPDGLANVYGMSSPVLLGQLQIDGQGSFSGTLSLPAELTVGSHTLQVNAQAPNGEVRSVSLGIEVVPAGALAHVAGSRIYFDYESAKLTKKSRTVLAALVGQVPDGVTAGTVVVGVTGKKATDQEKSLAKKRAKATAKYLRKAGLTGPITTKVVGVAVKNHPDDRRVAVTTTFTG